MRPTLIAGLTLVVAALTLAGCDSIFGSDDEPPSQARVLVQGTSPVPLQLVTSSNFTRFRDDTGEVTIELHASDTLVSGPPLERTQSLSGTNVGFFARLTNPDTALATVRMQVFIDGRVRYDQEADMRDASLEFSFVFAQ